MRAKRQADSGYIARRALALSAAKLNAHKEGEGEDTREGGQGQASEDITRAVTIGEDNESLTSAFSAVIVPK